jgi:hypothetical protein
MPWVFYEGGGFLGAGNVYGIVDKNGVDSL